MSNSITKEQAENEKYYLQIQQLIIKNPDCSKNQADKYDIKALIDKIPQRL